MMAITSFLRRQGQNLALTVLYVPSSLKSGSLLLGRNVEGS